MSTINIGALAQFALECKAEELRKRDPDLTEAQAFAKAYTDPTNREIANAERFAYRNAMARPGDVSTEIAKRDNAMDALTVKAEEIRKAHPNLTPEQSFSKAYHINVGLQAQERAAARAALFA